MCYNGRSCSTNDDPDASESHGSIGKRRLGRVGHVLLGTLGTHPTIEEARSARAGTLRHKGRRDEDWERVNELDDLDR